MKLTTGFFQGHIFVSVKYMQNIGNSQFHQLSCIVVGWVPLNQPGAILFKNNSIRSSRADNPVPNGSLPIRVVVQTEFILEENLSRNYHNWIFSCIESSYLLLLCFSNSQCFYLIQWINLFVQLLFWKSLYSSPIYLHSIFEISSSQNWFLNLIFEHDFWTWFLSISNLIFTACVACKKYRLVSKVVHDDPLTQWSYV